MPDCKFGCGTEIQWSQGADGKWVALGPDGERHQCPNYKKEKLVVTPHPSPPPVSVTPAILSDPYDLIKALNGLAAEVRELRRVLEAQPIVS